MTSRLHRCAQQVLLRASNLPPTHIRSTQQFKGFATSFHKMASQQSPVGEAISETARREGGPAKGSASAQMQSQATKTRNFEEAVQEIGTKMESAPASVNSQDAAYLKSREARVIGQNQPPAVSISAEAQRLASANEGATKQDTSPMDPFEQSAKDRVSNFEAVADDVARKLANDPESVTREEADLLHSREHRAFGNTSKGGIASQAQSVAAENEKQGTV